MLANQVFCPKNHKKFTSILYPEIETLMLSKIKDLEKSPSTKVIFIEGATILEAGFNKHFDEIWSSIVPKEDQVHRALNRSKLKGLGQSRGDLER